MTEFCTHCKKVTPSRRVNHNSGVEWLCAACGNQVDFDFHDDADFDDNDRCPKCGGDGSAEYDDCQEVWGEDCPSEINHLVECPQCHGTGRL